MILPQELGLARRSLSVVDVGAAFFGERPFYQSLLEDGWARLFAFEPDESQLPALAKALPEGSVILPYALGDGAEHTLHVAPGGMSSLYESDPEGYGFYTLFADGRFAARSTVRVPTRRLDDVTEVASADLFKLDIQGAELMVIENARETLKRASVLQVEVSFVPLYKDQPLFADVDAELRAQGFMVHGLASLKRLPVSPYAVRGPLTGLNQLIDLDMIYMRDLRRPETVDDALLRSTAVIMDDCYGSADVTLRCLVELERRGSCPRGLPKAYVASLTGRGQPVAVHHTPRPRPAAAAQAGQASQ